MSPEPQPTRLLRLFPLNQRFGSGAFRRRMRLHHQGGVVQGVLDDNNHAMWLRLAHDGAVVTGVTGGFYRPPTTGCLGAPDRLDELVGTPVATPRQLLMADGRALRQCTHLYDLADLALAMAARPEGDRVWDAVVPDPLDGATVATIDLDGARVHAWRLHDSVIQPDDGGAPQSLLADFTPWAAARFAGDALEGATVLRMSAFTARARAHVTDDRAWPLAAFPERHGACHAYASPRFETAEHRVGVVRDFSQALIESPWPDAGA